MTSSQPDSLDQVWFLISMAETGAQVNSVTLLMHRPVIIRGFTPLSANVLALTEVFAVGENFYAGSGLVIIFGAQKVQAELVRAGVIRVSVRPDAIATVQVSVSNNDGVDVVVASQTITFFSGGLNCPNNCGTPPPWTCSHVQQSTHTPSIPSRSSWNVLVGHLRMRRRVLRVGVQLLACHSTALPDVRVG